MANWNNNNNNIKIKIYNQNVRRRVLQQKHVELQKCRKNNTSKNYIHKITFNNKNFYLLFPDQRRLRHDAQAVQQRANDWTKNNIENLKKRLYFFKNTLIRYAHTKPILLTYETCSDDCHWLNTTKHAW